jgi:two-component system, NtrC family, response regulator GlrR
MGFMKPPASRPVSLGFGIIPRKKPADADPSAPPKRLVKVLVVDQDPSLRRIMTALLGAADYAVSTAESGRAALDACVRSRPNLVISELRLDDMGGLALLKELKSRWPHITVIILTSHATIPDAVQATQGGAFSFLVKPVGKHELLGHVERATAASNFPMTAGDWREQIVSRSRLMEDRLAIANRAAASTVPALLTGASGTGKELLARSIHAASMRRDNPFVTVSCGSASGADLGTELFGEESPADAGDAGPGAGAFERAREGTLLLDEVGDLPASLQLALLRVLRKELNPTVPQPIQDAANADVRLICTTSRDLKAAVETGGFLRDLYDRINILPIEMPPLGRRREDIPLLVSHFLEQAREPGRHEKIYTPEAIELLATTDWPGNVSQLFDLVKKNVALSRGKVMTKEFVQQSMPADPGKIPTYDEARDAFARAYLADNLQRTSGNVTKAARIAKRTRTDFYKLLARYRVEPDDFKPPPRGRREE